jgi:hypothetical protein
VPARAITAAASRTPVGNDADHFTKPGRQDVFLAAYAVARERDPERFPPITRDEA